MFKKFSSDEGVSSSSQLKNSVQRSIQAQIVEQYPNLEEAIELILPKKDMKTAKCNSGAEPIQLILVNNEIVFFQQQHGPFFPSLRLLHKYPTMMNRMQVDKGAIRFVLAGANIMCPGFTSAGGSMPVPIAEEQPVAIYAEGKQHAMALGLTKMSTAQIAEINKGIAVETVHFLMDGLWQSPSI